MFQPLWTGESTPGLPELFCEGAEHQTPDLGTEEARAETSEGQGL